MCIKIATLFLLLFASLVKDLNNVQVISDKF